jgi:hypothetical protein
LHGERQGRTHRLPMDRQSLSIPGARPTGLQGHQTAEVGLIANAGKIVCHPKGRGPVCPNEPTKQQSLSAFRLEPLEPDEVEPCACREDDIEHVPHPGEIGKR